MADDTTDVSEHTIWSIFTADGLSKCLLNEINQVLKNESAQTYDGANVMKDFEKNSFEKYI